MENTLYHPLFDYDSIVDTAMTVAHLIREEYWSSKYFIPLNDDNFLQCLFATMPTRDPMSHLVTDKYMDRCDELYDELIADSKFEDHIYTYAVADLLNVMHNTGISSNTVLVKNDREAKIIKSLYKDTVKILKSPEPLAITGKHGIYYTDNIHNLVDRLAKPDFINFRVMKMRFNMEPKQGFEVFNLDVVTQLSSTNTLASVQSYVDLILPEEE